MAVILLTKACLGGILIMMKVAVATKGNELQRGEPEGAPLVVFLEKL